MGKEIKCLTIGSSIFGAIAAIFIITAIAVAITDTLTFLPFLFIGLWFGLLTLMISLPVCIKTCGENKKYI